MKDYERCYSTIDLQRNSTNAKNAPEFVSRNIFLSDTYIYYFLDCIRQDKRPQIDVALFLKNVKNSPDKVVLTISVPFFKNPKRTTNLEEFFQ